MKKESGKLNKKDALQAALDFTMYWETGETEDGVSNDPVDRGGYTKYGFSKKYHPEIDFDNFTEQDARSKAINEYWNPIRGDLLAQVDPGLALVMFDSSIHHGPETVIAMLQRALKIKRDGVFGPITTREVVACDPYRIRCEIIALRIRYMHKIALYDSTQNKYIYGWFRRVSYLSAEARCLIS